MKKQINRLVLHMQLLLCATAMGVSYSQAQQTTWQLPSKTTAPLSANPFAGSNPQANEATRIQTSSARPHRPLFSGETAVTTGFSGTSLERSQDGASDPDALRFINLDGISASLTALGRLGSGMAGQEITRRPYDALLARDIGQVFGIAIDDQDSPNLYLTATSAYGLHIVGPDADGDGIADRLLLGGAGARWMPGLFGSLPEGGPGTIWKIDGISGQVSLFANLTLDGAENSGPGLGNIAFDAANQQFFVSDLDTGMIHRLDMDGNQLELFDHGITGRANEQLPTADFDVNNRLDITDPSFDAEDPDSWHYAAPERRVWGLAVSNGRLYYAVADGPQIWSVGIDPQSGAFTGDARSELTIASDHPDFEVSDITFAPDGTMLLAQRGGRIGSFDYSKQTKPRKARVLRYQPAPQGSQDGSLWAEQSVQIYPVGFSSRFNNGLGGLALGPGYDHNGNLSQSSCKSTLWTTGETLRSNPSYAQELAKGGNLDVDGLQAQPLHQSSGQNTPPWTSYFFDYDGLYPGGKKVNGHIGDVEIFGCKNPVPAAPVPPVVITPPPPPPPQEPGQPDLVLIKEAEGQCEANRAAYRYHCDFTIKVINQGTASYSGPVVMSDSFGLPRPLSLDSAFGRGWTCTRSTGKSVACLNGNLTLAPGEHSTIFMSLTLPGMRRGAQFENCAVLGVGTSRYEQISILQHAMTALGIDVGVVDGVMGRRTRAGIRRLESLLGLPVTGDLSPDLFIALGVPLAEDGIQSCAVVDLPPLRKPRDPRPIPDPVPVPIPVPDDPPIFIPPVVAPDPIFPPQCNKATTVRKGRSCVCRYKRMNKVSPVRCACVKGTKFIAGRGCLPIRAPLQCDKKTTVKLGGKCACKYQGMRKISATQCVCTKGRKFVAGKGCVKPTPILQCDKATTVKKAKRCVCRYNNMRKVSPTSCACKKGTRFVRGKGCIKKPIIIKPPVVIKPPIVIKPPVVIKPPIVRPRCDKKTTIAKGNRCVCRKGMRRISPTRCAKIVVKRPQVIKPPKQANPQIKNPKVQKPKLEKKRVERKKIEVNKPKLILQNGIVVPNLKN